MYYKTMLSILAKSLIISFQYNIESICFFYSNPGINRSVWTQLDYGIDICRVTKGSHIEHFVT